MKNIIVPTDFSAYAHYAFDVALLMAKKYRANLYVYHNFEAPKDWEQMNLEEQKLFPEVLQRSYNAKVLLEDMKRIAEETTVRILPIFTGGRFYKNMNTVVSDINADLVIMGSHGASGISELFVGSNTQKIVRSLQCPILVIKNPLDKIAFKKVAFASSFDESEKESFKIFLDFIKHFNPEIHLVAINTSSFFSQPYSLMRTAMNDFKSMTNLPCKIHFYKDYYVDKGIEHFTQENDIDLLAISNHSRHPIKRIFSGSTVEALVNHANVPVLSVDYIAQ